MAGDVGSVAGTLGETLLWSDLGGGELVLALIVGLVLLAFALPARLSGRIEGQGPEARARAGHLSHR
jgi:hypothetical protein